MRDKLFISRHGKTVKQERKKIICPNCDGTCKEEDGSMCKDCLGTGRVEIIEES